MKLAIDCRLFGNSGIGTFIKNIVEYLILNNNDSFLLIGRSEDLMAYAQYPNVQILENQIKPFTLKELFYFPTKEINQCDAFFTPYINLPLNIRIPIFSTIHDVIFFDLKEITSSIGRLVRRFFYWNACKNSNVLFTVSNFSKKRIEHHFKPSTPIEIIYNGVSERIKREKPNKTDKKNYILYVGNVKPHKGLKTLVEAFHLITKEEKNLQLMIVGEYKNFKTADHEVLHLLNNLQNDVIFTGRLTDTELIRTIQQAKVLVLPSLYEGFGIPPLEALYLGTNAIISDILPLKEIYHELPVTFFQVGNAEDLAQKLQKDETFKELDWKNIREDIDNKYNFQITANRLLKIIKNNI